MVQTHGWYTSHHGHFDEHVVSTKTLRHRQCITGLRIGFGYNVVHIFFNILSYRSLIRYWDGGKRIEIYTKKLQFSKK